MLIEEKAEFGMQITEYLPLHGHRPNMQKRRIFENQNNGFLIFEKLDYGLFLVLHGHPNIPVLYSRSESLTRTRQSLFLTCWVFSTVATSSFLLATNFFFPSPALLSDEVRSVNSPER
jgi:hypothetical protein